MTHHPYSHLYRHYRARSRPFSRIQPRRATYQANHDMTRLLAAIGWYP